MERQYKDSGIEWIGRIPEKWEISSIKHLMQLYAGATPKSDNEELWDGDIPWITPADYKTEDVYVSGGRRNISEKGLQSCATTVLPINNIIFSKRAPIGLVALNSIPLCTNQGCIGCIVNQQKANSKYYYYVLSVFTEQFELFGSGTTFKEISANNFANFKITVPSLDEQHRIADYLDEKCGGIDSLIGLQEQRIEKLTAYKQSVITEAVTKGLAYARPDLQSGRDEYQHLQCEKCKADYKSLFPQRSDCKSDRASAKLVPSGIDWIGDIPEGWRIGRIKNVASLFGRIGFRGYTSDDLNKDGEGAITLSPSNMKSMGMDYSNVTYLSWWKYHESPEIKIQNGDLLMVKTGSSYGKVSYVDNLPRESTINPQILRIVPRINSKFLGYYLQTTLFLDQVECGVVGGTIPTIAQEKINNFRVILPPEAEQQTIASYLDGKCSEIDKLIDVKQKKIERLKDYKKSVIYEAVTGKTDLRDN